VTTTRNYDYTVSLSDKSGNVLTFRDIRGSDLEFLDYQFQYNPDSSDQKVVITRDSSLNVLERLLVFPQTYDLKRLTNRVMDSVFISVREEILVNYMPKIIWLKNCYGIQDGSFANLKAMEEVPMSKFQALVDIHKEALENLKPTPNLETDVGSW